MKNFKFIYLLFVAVVALAFTACDKHEWTPGEPDATQGVFFPSTVETTYTVEKTATSVTIPVMRTNVEVASEVSVRSDDPSELFTIPSSVAFAANSENSELVISFDGAALTAGTFYSIALQISSDNASNYGYSELTIKIGVPEPWNDLGEGIYLDDFLRYLLEDVPAGLGSYVPMQQHADDGSRPGHDCAGGEVHFTDGLNEDQTGSGNCGQTGRGEQRGQVADTQEGGFQDTDDHRKEQLQ